MRTLIQALTAPLVRWLFRIRESRQPERPEIYFDGPSLIELMRRTLK